MIFKALASRESHFDGGFIKIFLSNTVYLLHILVIIMGNF